MCTYYNLIKNNENCSFNWNSNTFIQMVHDSVYKTYSILWRCFKQRYFYKAISELNCAALLHTILKMNTSLSGDNIWKLPSDKGSNQHLHNFVHKLSLQHKAEICAGCFSRLTHHRSLRSVERIIIFRVCEQHLWEAVSDGLLKGTHFDLR